MVLLFGFIVVVLGIIILAISIYLLKEKDDYTHYAKRDQDLVDKVIKKIRDCPKDKVNIDIDKHIYNFDNICIRKRRNIIYMSKPVRYIPSVISQKRIMGAVMKRVLRKGIKK